MDVTTKLHGALIESKGKAGLGIAVIEVTVGRSTNEDNKLSFFIYRVAVLSLRT